MEDISQMFYLPLSSQAHSEMILLQGELNSLVMHESGKDCWKTVWKDGVYTSSLYYHPTFREQVVSKLFSHIWSSKCILRIKVFAWLLLSDRLNTRDMLRRRNCNVTNILHCELCPTGQTEDWQHLFFQCSVRIWTYLQIEWGQEDTLENTVQHARNAFNKPFFFEVIIIACWHIWKQRNGAIFEGVMPTFRSWKAAFVHDITLHICRVKKAHQNILTQWIETLM